MRIVTWNVNSVRVRHPHVESLVESERPDVLCMQETKVINNDYPKFDFEYQRSVNGQKAYNGVSAHTFNKHHDVEINPLACCEAARIIAFTYRKIRFINVYIPSGGSSGVEGYNHKLQWLYEFVSYVGKTRSIYKYVIVLGDYNICPTDNDVYDPCAWNNKITCTAPERNAFADLISLGFVDTMNTNCEFTWWNYQQRGYANNHGLRIDHILVTENLAPFVRSTKVLTKYRELDRPSDHAPVMIEIKKYM